MKTTTHIWLDYLPELLTLFPTSHKQNDNTVHIHLSEAFCSIRNLLSIVSFFFLKNNLTQWYFIIESSASNCSYPTESLTSFWQVSMISLMALGFKLTNQIFGTSVNAWWKTLYLCQISKMEVGHALHKPTQSLLQSWTKLLRHF